MPLPCQRAQLLYNIQENVLNLALSMMVLLCAIMGWPAISDWLRLCTWEWHEIWCHSLLSNRVGGSMIWLRMGFGGIMSSSEPESESGCSIKSISGLFVFYGEIGRFRMSMLLSVIWYGVAGVTVGGGFWTHWVCVFMYWVYHWPWCVGVYAYHLWFLCWYKLRVTGHTNHMFVGGIG